MATKQAVKWINGDIPEVKAFLDSEMKDIQPEYYKKEEIDWTAQVEKFEPLFRKAIMAIATGESDDEDCVTSYEARFLLSKLLWEDDIGELDQIVDMVSSMVADAIEYGRSHPEPKTSDLAIAS